MLVDQEIDRRTPRTVQGISSQIAKRSQRLRHERARVEPVARRSQRGAGGDAATTKSAARGSPRRGVVARAGNQVGTVSEVRSRRLVLRAIAGVLYCKWNTAYEGADASDLPSA